MKRAIALLLMLSMLFALISGCAANDEPDNASEPVGPQASEPVANTDNKVFTFGCIAQFSNAIGLNMVNSLTAWVDKLNNDGGVKIGDEYYDINMITYDSDGNQSTANAAVERLIYEDKVDYIISDTNIVDSWLHICEENDVVALVVTAGTECYNNDWDHIYEVGSKNAMAPAMLSWYFEKNPDTRHIVTVYPDNTGGEQDNKLFQDIMAALAPEIEVTAISYPADTSDMSAIGTRVTSLDPDVFIPVGGGPNAIGNACKAARQAGYTGALFSTSPFAGRVLLNFIDAKDANGFINCALPTEFEEPTTEIAKQFKQAYVDYYGEWDYPEIVATSSFFCLLSAVQEAGTTDKDTVRALLDNGFSWEAPTGSSQMVPRPDQGWATRTVDSIQNYTLKGIDENGDIHVIEDIELEQVHEAFTIYTEWLGQN